MADDMAVAVIIPTLNESRRIGGLLQQLTAMPFSQIIVADGGSSDDTVSRVASFGGVSCLVVPPGRGRQLAAAVHATDAPVLLLLHADTLPPPDAVDDIRRALAVPGVVGGCFRLRFDDETPLMRASAWLSRFETPLTTFGDQGYFMLREALTQAGGIPDWPLLEDVELRRRLRKVGRFVKLKSSVTTSARRLRARGVVAGQLRNAVVLAGYWCGVPLGRLADFYGARRTFERGGPLDGDRR